MANLQKISPIVNSINSQVSAVYLRTSTTVRTMSKAGSYSVWGRKFSGKTSGIIGKKAGATLTVRKLSGKVANMPGGGLKNTVPTGFDIYVTDQITPTVVELETWAEFILPQQMATVFKRSIGQKVRKFYNTKNNGKWAPNTKMWRKWKMERGYDTRPMHMHDSAMRGKIRPLSETVRQFGKLITVTKVSKNTYAVTGLEAEFFANPYVWLHEVGYSTKGAIPGKKVPARPFIVPAMQEAAVTAMRVVHGRNPLTKSPSSISYKVGPGIYSSKVEGSSAGVWRWLWYFIPQVEEYKYLGAVYDIHGYMTGDFMDVSTLKRFAGALVMGKAGQMGGMPLSSKMARRSSRKALWGTSSVSLLGSA